MAHQQIKGTFLYSHSISLYNNIIVLMNTQFSGARSPSTGTSAYNAKKTNPISSTASYQSVQSNGTGFGSINSKNLISRSNIFEQPKNNNQSGYAKGSNQTPAPVQLGKFITNSVISPTSTLSNNFSGFIPGSFSSKGNSNEMAKSVIQQNPKIAENLGSPTIPLEKPAFIGNSLNRRPPRMSQSMQIDVSPPVIQQKSNSNQQVSSNVSLAMQKRFKDPKQFQNHFLKNKLGSANLIEDQKGNKKLAGSQANMGRTQIWSKQSSGKKKYISIADFEKIKDLGSGKYGQVCLVKERSTGFVCALKMIQKKVTRQQDIIDQFIRELKIQLYLNHPNIIKMYSFFDDQTYIYIIMEVATGGQLYHQLRRSKPMPQNKVACIMKQICEAVNQIHSQRIIHRDIKPENIVLQDNVVKLCDFGWSVYLDNKLRTTFCGTPLYVCPQILKGKQYDEKIDIWSLGIIMYEMVVGQNPFKISKEEELIKIVKDQISIPSYVFVSREARDFLDKCLKKNPSDRVAIKDLLNHQFFAKVQDKGQKKMNF